MQTHQSKQNKTSSNNGKSDSGSHQSQPVSPSIDQIDIENLTPDNVIALQRQFGNQYVLKMMQRKKDADTTSSTNSQPTPLIQRAGGTRSIHDQDETVDDPGLNDTVGTIGDYLGANPDEGLSIMGGDNGTGDQLTGVDLGTTGSVISTVTGTVGTGIGVYNMYKNIKNHTEANAALKENKTKYEGDGTIPGDKELYATVELLKRKKSDAVKGEWENAGNILGGISGFINGVSGFFSGATAAMVSGVAFGVGAGLNAIIGTISAIRDFVSAGKRAKTKKEIGKVRAGYIELYNGLGSETEQLKNENDDRQSTLNGLRGQLDDKLQQIADVTLELDTARAEAQDEETSIPVRQQKIAQVMLLKNKLPGLNEEKNSLQQQAQQLGQQIAGKAQDILDKEGRYDDYGKIITALKTSERKQGYGGKIATGSLNLISAAGGAALLAATLGAGAAAGPVGWVLSGVALLGILGYAIGMHVKRKIRKSNVKRMTQEMQLVGDYVANGTVTGTLPDGYNVSATAEERQDDIWHRQMFPTTEKKGWFNKLISKKRSGTMTMKERTDLMKDYLGKYDTGTQGDTVVKGFANALKDGSEGDQMVSNPAYTDDLSPEIKAQTPTEITLRALNMGLLAHFFGDKANDMKASLLVDPDNSEDDKKKFNAAKDLLKKKMKLS